jgi:Asp-tRNA(Asn)/Glu-tRNA(Gln) amidotransferase C subunit
MIEKKDIEKLALLARIEVSEEEEKDGEKIKLIANTIMEIQTRIFMSKDP